MIKDFNRGHDGDAESLQNNGSKMVAFVNIIVVTGFS